MILSKEFTAISVFIMLMLPFTSHVASGQDAESEGAESEGAESEVAEKPSILIHLSQGPENPTVAALAFLIARTAVEEGHQVTLFLAGDAVQLMRDGALNNLTGLGTGELEAHYRILAKNGCEFYLSGMSSKSRGLTENEVEGKNVTFASPRVLLNLALENDRMFVY